MLPELNQWTLGGSAALLTTLFGWLRTRRGAISGPVWRSVLRWVFALKHLPSVEADRDYYLTNSERYRTDRDQQLAENQLLNARIQALLAASHALVIDSMRLPTQMNQPWDGVTERRMNGRGRRATDQVAS